MNTVKNLKGTGNLTCSCGSWIKHWEKFTSKKAKLCTATGCLSPATIGGHVIKCNSTDKDHYIIPLCHSCNMRIDIYNTTAILAPANVQDTCG